VSHVRPQAHPWLLVSRIWQEVRNGLQEATVSASGKSKQIARRSVGQSVLVSGTHLGAVTTSCGVVDVGALSDERTDVRASSDLLNSHNP
jgi:hypothetical protein